MNIAQHIERDRNLFPDRPALIFEGKSFTYRQIDEMANRVANALEGDAIAPGDRVALFLPNIPSFVTVYLGIAKMGAVAVSINSTLKADEVEFILGDSGAKILVTTESLRAHVPDGVLPRQKGIVIAEGNATGADTALDEWTASASREASAVPMASGELAAILYTSGTTGFPKGAALSHGNILSSTRASVEALEMRAEDRVLLFLPLFHSFAQTAAMNPCFEVGAALVLQREFELASALDRIVDNGITTLYGVPTIYTLLYDNASIEQMHSVRRCISAAANLPLELAGRWREKFRIPIREGYGLTETCLACFNRDPDDKPGSVGAPIGDMEVKAVDSEGREVAPGELGELAIRGPSVMPGYWDRPQETADVVKEDWFHTGDIGKMDGDGCFYIVDRVKDMINVGGIKAYPSEIEGVLYGHPAVSEVAVYGVMDDTLGEQVRASIVLKPNRDKMPEAITPENIIAEEIIEFCRQRMADFKAPSIIHFVGSLPKSRTGKILKRVLREKAREEPIQKDLSGAQGSDRPLTERLSEIWAAILGLEKIGLHDNFFALGGNSFLATRITLKAQTDLGVALSVRSLFEAPTVAELARYMESRRLENNEKGGLAIEPVSREGPLPLSLFQQRIWLLSHESEGLSHTYHLPIILRIQGRLNANILQQTLDEILRRHETLRTVFREIDGEPMQIILPESRFPLSNKEIPNISAMEREAESGRLAIEEARAPFVLSTGPLARASLLETGPDEQLLVIILHHIVADFRSIDIFKQELAQLYNAFIEGKASPLPELDIQYADFAHWEHRSITRERLEARLAYWEEWLAAEPAPLELPIDRPRPPVESFRCSSEEFRVPPGLTAKLIDLGGQSNATLFVTLMAAFAASMLRWSGHEEIVVGAPFVERGHPRLAPLIGYFSNALLVRIDIKGNPSFLELLRQVRDANRSALANQDIPFRYLVQKLQPGRELRGNAPYRVLLNLLPANPTKTFTLGDATAISSEGDNKIRRDVVLNFWEETDGHGTALRGAWRYKTELFDAATIAGLDESFRMVLEAVAADPRLPVESLPNPMASLQK